MLKTGDRVRVINAKSAREYAAHVKNGDEGTVGKRYKNGDINFQADGEKYVWYLLKEDVELITKEAATKE